MSQSSNPNCRSINEDLPGFNGAGLYDSKTQNPDETVEDGIDKSLKGVFASLWTFRAFTEREFHRIDHLAAAMGVLVHPNYKDELANGVAVSFDPTDPTYGSDDWYYVNTQVGEDLVTNPEAHSVPEEILVYKDGTYRVLATSNQVPLGQLLMSNAQVTQLRDHLTAIHDHFEALYDPATGEPFAMEIEFKITSENILAIKQARPWVFGDASSPPPPTPPPPPPTPTPTPTPTETQQPTEQSQPPLETQQPTTTDGGTSYLSSSVKFIYIADSVFLRRLLVFSIGKPVGNRYQAASFCSSLKSLRNISPFLSRVQAT